MGMSRLLLSALVLPLLAAGVLAQPAGQAPLRQDGQRLVLQDLGHEVALPLSEWMDNGDTLSSLEVHYESDGSEALLTLMPRGETEALWTKLYGARLSRSAGLPLTEYRQAAMDSFSATCQPQRTGYFQFSADAEGKLAALGMVCGAYHPALSTYANLGEVMVMSFRQTAEGVAIIYQEWRGDAFDPADPASWPVDTAVVEARARQLDAEAALTLVD